MKVFIENEAGSNQKNLYNEKTLEYRKTVEVSRKYPYPYGFIIATTSGDGDNLDCFILTKQELKTGSIVECEPIGLMEQFEDGKEDHNVLATLKDESAEVNPEVKEKLTEFVSHVFDHRKGKMVKVGSFYNKEKAEEYIEKCRDENIVFSKEDFENFWPLTNVKIGKILQKSGERIVCEIFANEGLFVFKIADPSKTEEKIKLDTFVFDFLKAKSFQNIPILLKTKEGENYQNLDGKFVYVMERIDGKAPERTPENWARLGEIAAKLHDISDYPYKTLFTIESEMPKFAETAAKLSFTKEYMTLVESLPNFSGLSTSLIHTDIGPNNAVQRKDGVIVLTDWDDAGIGTTILDLGFPLICHFVTHELEFEKEKASAFYSAYFGKIKLSQSEKSLIFDAGLFFALMYIPYGETEKHWQRIKFAVKNKELISSVLI